MIEIELEPDQKTISQKALNLLLQLTNGNIEHAHQLRTELRNLYWTTNIKCEEINNTYLANVPKNLRTWLTVEIAGHVYRKEPCQQCQKRQIIHSRSQRQEQTKWHPAHWQCHECREKQLDQQYQERLAIQQQIVWQLKTMPYAEYLRTPWWQKQRRLALQRAGFACQLCCKKNAQLNVHHRTYVRRGEEATTDLITLCAECHQLFHKQRKLND